MKEKEPTSSQRQEKIEIDLEEFKDLDNLGFFSIYAARNLTREMNDSSYMNSKTGRDLLSSLWSNIADLSNGINQEKVNGAPEKLLKELKAEEVFFASVLNYLKIDINEDKKTDVFSSFVDGVSSGQLPSKASPLVAFCLRDAAITFARIVTDSEVTIIPDLVESFAVNVGHVIQDTTDTHKQTE